MNNEMKGAKPILAERLYEMSKEDSVYCTLEKYDNPDDAFRAMAGSYEGGTFVVLDDETFPKFVFGNVIDLLYIQEIGDMTKEEIDFVLTVDVDGIMSTLLIDNPFILWSAKLEAYYVYHYDIEYGFSDDESVEAAYKELIECYDIASIVKYAKETVAVNGKVFGKDINAYYRLREMYGLHSRKTTL